MGYLRRGKWINDEKFETMFDPPSYYCGSCLLLLRDKVRVTENMVSIMFLTLVYDETRK
jgi:hypothetical protein